MFGFIEKRINKLAEEQTKRIINNKIDNITSNIDAFNSRIVRKIQTTDDIMLIKLISNTIAETLRSFKQN